MLSKIVNFVGPKSPNSSKLNFRPNLVPLLKGTGI